MAPSISGRPVGPGCQAAPQKSSRPGSTAAPAKQSEVRLLVLGQDAHGVAAARPDDRGQEPAPVERDHDQRRVERDRAQRVHRDPERPLAVERGHHGHAGHEMTHDPPERVRDRWRSSVRAPMRRRKSSGSRPADAAHDRGDPGTYNRGMTETDRPADPHRARFDGRDGGPGRRPVRRVDPAGRPQLPDLRPADAAPVPPRAGPDQARGGRDERASSACSTPTSPARSRRPRHRSPTATTTTSSRSTSTRRARAPRPTPT